MYNAGMKKIILPLIAVIILLAIGDYVYRHSPRIPDLSIATTTPAATSGSGMTMQRITDDTDTYTIDAQYPQFGIPSVDAKIKSDLDAALTEFKGYPANPPESAVPKNQFNSDVGGAYVGPDVVSVSLEISEYTGGAHPNTVIDAINVDPRSGKSLALTDALSLIGMNLQQVASSSLAQLKDKLGDVVFEEGAQPTQENYQSFLINADSVTFVFQNYQVAPYAAGIQEVSFHRVR